MLESLMQMAEAPFPIAIESGDVAISDTSERLIASDAGAHSSCDVWFNVGGEWIGRAKLRLYARLGAARILMKEVALSRAPVTTGADNRLSGIAITVRGRPCDAFELTAQATAGDPIDGGLFYLQAWHAPSRVQSTGGLGAPENDEAVEVVAARLVGKDPANGTLTEIAVDGTGRLLMGNPLFTDAIKALLDGATAGPTPSTLMLRDGAGATALTRVELADTTNGGTPAGQSWLWSEGGRVVAKEPNGVVDSLSFVDGASGGASKMHRKYFGRVAVTSATTVAVVTVPASDLPTGEWSGEVTARIHAYDVSHDQMCKLTREAGVRRTASTIVLPTQSQSVGTDLVESPLSLTSSLAVAGGNIVVNVTVTSPGGLPGGSVDVRWAAWVEVFVVAH